MLNFLCRSAHLLTKEQHKEIISLSRAAQASKEANTQVEKTPGEEEGDTAGYDCICQSYQWYCNFETTHYCAHCCDYMFNQWVDNLRQRHWALCRLGCSLHHNPVYECICEKMTEESEDK